MYKKRLKKQQSDFSIQKAKWSKSTPKEIGHSKDKFKIQRILKFRWNEQFP